MTGDTHIIRNAGGIVTDDSLRSLFISHYLLDTEEIMVINHTDCGLMHTSEEELRTRIQERTGTAAIAPAFFFAFQNIEENVRHSYRNYRPILGFPKRSLFEASCMTSAAADCAKSNRFDRLKPNRPAWSSRRDLHTWLSPYGIRLRSPNWRRYQTIIYI
jgi:hypothetical protein